MFFSKKNALKKKVPNFVQKRSKIFSKILDLFFSHKKKRLRQRPQPEKHYGKKKNKPKKIKKKEVQKIVKIAQKSASIEI